MLVVFGVHIGHWAVEKLGVARVFLRPAIRVDALFSFQSAPGARHRRRRLSLTGIHICYILWHHILVVVNRTVCIRTVRGIRLTRVRH